MSVTIKTYEQQKAKWWAADPRGDKLQRLCSAQAVTGSCEWPQRGNELDQPNSQQRRRARRLAPLAGRPCLWKALLALFALVAERPRPEPRLGVQ
jgi:hypothetical protein